MNTQGHVAELKRRHAELDRKISEAQSHPSTDEVEIHEMKRRKLHLKEEIVRLSMSLH